MELGVLFLAKKIVSFMLYPLSIAILLALAGFALFKRHKRAAKILFVTSFVWIFLISSSFFSNWLLAGLESEYKPIKELPKGVEYIVLLGGDSKRRAWEALRLYRLATNAKIITSGYSAKGQVPEAQKSAKLLESVGVAKEDILMQSDVKDTIEEAESLKRRLGEQPFFLVTSAYHMPRAMRIFRKFRLNAIAAPTDFNDPAEGGVISLLSGRELDKTQKALHEYLGLLWLKIFH